MYWKYEKVNSQYLSEKHKTIDVLLLLLLQQVCEIFYSLLLKQLSYVTVDFLTKVIRKLLTTPSALTLWSISCVFTMLHHWQLTTTILGRIHGHYSKPVIKVYWLCFLLAKFFLLRLSLGKNCYAPMKGLLLHLRTLESCNIPIFGAYRESTKRHGSVDLIDAKKLHARPLIICIYHRGMLSSFLSSKKWINNKLIVRNKRLCLYHFHNSKQKSYW